MKMKRVANGINKIAQIKVGIKRKSPKVLDFRG
jgi:hypothetical protein